VPPRPGNSRLVAPSFPSAYFALPTRVTSPANACQRSTIVLLVFFSSRMSAFHVYPWILRDNSPRAPRCYRSRCSAPARQVLPGHEVHVVGETLHVPPTPVPGLPAQLPSCPLREPRG